MPRAVLDTAIVDIRYAYGHTYLDRCGQTLVDIERRMPEWVTVERADNSGTVTNAKRQSLAVFNSYSLNVTAHRPAEIAFFADATSLLWEIVSANLGLAELVRIGFRCQYLLPKNSTDEAEAAIARSELNIVLPARLAGYEPRIRNLTTILRKGNTDYRLSLQGISRVETTDPSSSLLLSRPSMLARNLRNAQIEAHKQLERKMASKPIRYAVQFDVDCSVSDPATIDIQEFVHDNFKIMKDDFLPIVEALE